jgi:hypothetical protein
MSDQIDFSEVRSNDFIRYYYEYIKGDDLIVYLNDQIKQRSEKVFDMKTADFEHILNTTYKKDRERILSEISSIENMCTRSKYILLLDKNQELNEIDKKIKQLNDNINSINLKKEAMMNEIKLLTDDLDNLKENKKKYYNFLVDYFIWHMKKYFKDNQIGEKIMKSEHNDCNHDHGCDCHRYRKIKFIGIKEVIDLRTDTKMTIKFIRSYRHKDDYTISFEYYNKVSYDQVQRFHFQYSIQAHDHTSRPVYEWMNV